MRELILNYPPDLPLYPLVAMLKDRDYPTSGITSFLNSYRDTLTDDEVYELLLGWAQ